MIRINKREMIAWHEGMTVREVLEIMHYTYPQLVVSVNETLVPEEAYDTQPIPDEAEVAIIHLIAGG